MKSLVLSIVAVASFCSIACGSVEHKSSPNIVPEDPFFVSSLPAETPTLDKRYYCKDGFYINRAAWTNDELANLQLGFDMVNDHVKIAGLAHFTDDKDSNCQLNKDTGLAVDNGDGTETLAYTTATQYADGKIDINLAIYSELSTLIKESSWMHSTDGFYSVIVLHELMHVLRSGHLPEGKKGVMAAVANGGSITWSADDQEICENIHACPKE